MTYDEEFISILESCGIQTGVENQEYWFDVLEDMFPIGLNRIAWQKVGVQEMLHIGSTSENKAEAKEKVLNFMNSKFKQNNVCEDEGVIVLSDGALEDTYTVKVSDLKQIFEHIFFLPQHTYVIPKNGQWCLNYTFEDDLFFGISPLELVNSSI